MNKFPKSYKIIVLAILALGVVLFSLWGINKYINEKMFEKGYAEIFDECMSASYPLLVNSANAFYVRANVFEQNAMEAIVPPKFLELNRKKNLMKFLRN